MISHEENKSPKIGGSYSKTFFKIVVTKTGNDYKPPKTNTNNHKPPANHHN